MPPPENLVSRDAEQGSSIAVSPTPGDTQPAFHRLNGADAAVDDEIAWLKAKQDRIQERKELLRELQ